MTDRLLPSQRVCKATALPREPNHLPTRRMLDYEPGDERHGDWTREQVQRMDDLFRERVAQTLKRERA